MTQNPKTPGRVQLGDPGGNAMPAECNSEIPGKTSKPEWRSRGYMPHRDCIGLIQNITFHLADSLPASAIERIQQELAASMEPDSEKEIIRRQRIQELLDAGHGSCVLQNPQCAQIVEDAFLFSDGTRYRLFAWVVMPNHVHAVIQPMGNWALCKIVQSWKRHTARQINRLLNPGIRSEATALWQREYWDRFIRDARHLQNAIDYAHQNPVKARLVSSPDDWLWSSAWRFSGIPPGIAELYSAIDNTSSCREKTKEKEV